MPDAMERVQQFTADHVADSLARHADRERLPGRSTCANLDCGEAISPTRQQLGAQLCMDCLKAEEAAAVHQRTWRSR